MNHDDYCTRCERKIKQVVWLEMDQNTGRYYKPGQLPDGAISQGGFPFGPDCARVELASRP